MSMKSQLEEAMAREVDETHTFRSGVMYSLGALEGHCNSIRAEIRTAEAMGENAKADGLRKALELLEGVSS